MQTETCGRQLLLDAVCGRAIPRVPTGPLAVHYCARLAGVSLRDYTADPKVLADCVVRYWETFRPDAVWLSADTWVTAEAMGAEVAFPGDDQPLGGTGAPCIRSAADIDRIAPPDPSSQGRLPLMLDAARRIREAIGDEAALVACFDQYPFSLACALMGVETVMLKLIDDPPMVEALMERCLNYAAAYAVALAEAGADVLSGGDSPAGLLGPQMYREVALPLEQQLIRRLKSEVEQPVSLHICGDATRLLADAAQSGADILELDHAVDPAEAFRVLGSEITLWGNLDPVGVLARGTVDDVETAASALMAAARSNRGRLVLSSGCTLAIETPAENLNAMFAAAKPGM